MRTLIRITRLDEGDRAEAVIIGWNPDRTVAIDLNGIPQTIRKQIEAGLKNGDVRVFAQINPDATESENLRPSNWELAPIPSDDFLE